MRINYISITFGQNDQCFMMLLGFPKGLSINHSTTHSPSLLDNASLYKIFIF